MEKLRFYWWNSLFLGVLFVVLVPSVLADCDKSPFFVYSLTFCDVTARTCFENESWAYSTTPSYTVTMC